MAHDERWSQLIITRSFTDITNFNIPYGLSSKKIFWNLKKRILGISWKLVRLDL